MLRETEREKESFEIFMSKRGSDREEFSGAGRIFVCCILDTQFFNSYIGFVELNLLDPMAHFK